MDGRTPVDLPGDAARLRNGVAVLYDPLPDLIAALEAATEDAVDAGIEAAAEAVSAMPNKAWDLKEYRIAETAARGTIAALRARLAEGR